MGLGGQYSNSPNSLLMVRLRLPSSMRPTTCASMLKLLEMAMTRSASCGATYTSRRWPMLKTLYISAQSVPLCSWMILKSGGTGNILSLTTRQLSPTKWSTFVCAPPVQCTMPWMAGRISSSIFLTTGAYVLVGERTSLPTEH